MNWWFWTNV